MTVTDEAKLFAIRQQLLEMRYKLDASINIINYVFDRVESPSEMVGRSTDRHDSCTIDPVAKQIRYEEELCEE